MKAIGLRQTMVIGICSLTTLISSCSFSVTPVWNGGKHTPADTKATPMRITDRDDLKPKALEQASKLQRLIGERNFEEAYQMIDDNSPLKLPKEQAISNMQELVDTLGRLEKSELTRDIVVRDKSLNGGQLQIRQEFVVKYSKDTPTPKRYELFNWNVNSDGSITLWSYINSKGDE